MDVRQSWKPKTIKTLLSRLTNKGVLGFEKSGREYIYHPLVTREQAERAKSDRFVEQVFEGDAAPLIERVTTGGDRGLESFDPETLGELAWNWNNAQRATAAHAGQWNEAMSFLDPILKKHPEFLEARKLMRAAELKAGLKIPLGDRIPPPQSYIAKARKKVESGQPREAMDLLEEKVFVYLPANTKANIVLHEAALAALLPQTALFALEFAAAENESDREIFQKLAEHYQARGELDKACIALRQITVIDPGDPKASLAHKNMVALASMQGGKIEEKDRDGRLKLEQVEKHALTDDQKRCEMEVLVAAYEEQRGATETADEQVAAVKEGLRRAARFARELGEKSLPDLEYALELQHFLVEAFPEDPVLVAELDELGAVFAKKQLQVAEDEYLNCEDESEKEAKEARLDQLRGEAAETVLEVAQRAAHANPTKGEAQLELGRAFIGAGRFREAVKPLQRAKKDPRGGIDIEAMGLLADCFVEGKLVDLAQQELEAAIAKLGDHDSREADVQWKELKYKLARLSEDQDREDQAKAIYAEIYAQDSEYRDVEERVWGK